MTDRRVALDLKTVATLLVILGMLAAGAKAYGQLDQKVNQNEVAIAELKADLKGISVKQDRTIELIINLAKE